MAVCNRCKRFYDGSREEHERLYCDSTVHPDPKDRERIEFIRRAAIAYTAPFERACEGGYTQQYQRTPEEAVQAAQHLWEALQKAGC